MKKLLILIVICFAQNIFSQTTKTDILINDENQLYNNAALDVKPEFPGGYDQFYKFIGQNYRIPKEKGLKGKVFATFIIEKDGSVNEVKIIKDIGFGTGDEAIRVLKLCPKWIPGKLRDKEVRVMYAIPIKIN